MFEWLTIKVAVPLVLTFLSLEAGVLTWYSYRKHKAKQRALAKIREEFGPMIGEVVKKVIDGDMK